MGRDYNITNLITVATVMTVVGASFACGPRHHGGSGLPGPIAVILGPPPSATPTTPASPPSGATGGASSRPSDPGSKLFVSGPADMNSEVVVTVSRQPSTTIPGNIVYSYSVKNNTASTLVSLYVGRYLNDDGEYSGMISAKIASAPMAQAEGADGDGEGITQWALPGPDGWDGVATPVGQTSVGVELKWIAKDPTKGIAPGAKLDGFEVETQSTDSEMAGHFQAGFGLIHDNDLEELSGRVSQSDDYCSQLDCPAPQAPTVTLGRHVVLVVTSTALIPFYFISLPAGMTITTVAQSFHVTNAQVSSLTLSGQIPVQLQIAPDTQNTTVPPRGSSTPVVVDYKGFPSGDQTQPPTDLTDTVLVVYHPSDYITIGHRIPNFSPGTTGEPEDDSATPFSGFTAQFSPNEPTPKSSIDDGFPLDGFDTEGALATCKSTLYLPAIKQTASCMTQFGLIDHAVDLSLELCLRIAAIPYQQANTALFPNIMARLEEIDALDVHLHRTALIYGEDDDRTQSLIDDLAKADLDIQTRQQSISDSLVTTKTAMQVQLGAAQATVTTNNDAMTAAGCLQ